MAMSFVSCGDIEAAIWLHTADDPDQAQWTQAVERITEVKHKRNLDVSMIRTLVITDGGAPNTVQRGQLLSDALEGKATSAVVTTVLSNRLKRGIATAISWLNPSFRAFLPEEFDAALIHLDLVPHRDQLLAELESLQAKLPPVAAWATIRGQRRP